MSEESARRGPTRTRRSSSAELGTPGRCKAPSGAQRCSDRPKAFPCCVVGYLQGKTFVMGWEGLPTRSLRRLSYGDPPLRAPQGWPLYLSVGGHLYLTHGPLQRPPLGSLMLQAPLAIVHVAGKCVAYRFSPAVVRSLQIL
ncbi:hypothetical protein BHE74_00043195 [Ensete ventricosum]|nr:hypothetical protein BHE74_00043195 [Ensete ventricosum]RZS18659.1 hypothetical protein BHM03_00050973 [Ensete ventricosum]